MRRIQTTFVIVALLAALAYVPALTNGFVNWDDTEYVVNNYSIRDITPHAIAAFFSRPYVAHYTPLVVLSYALEYRVYGLRPLGYHATNVALHVLNSILVCAFACALSRRWRVAFVTAALFAVHPIHVESVAWVTERKDVLSAFFYLGSLLAYCGYVRRKGGRAASGARRYYLLSLLFFLCALLSKAMSISLPFVLIVLDYCHGQQKVPPVHRRGFLRRSIANKLPFFVLSAVFGAVIWIVSNSLGSMMPAFYRDILPHLLVAARNLIWYPAKIFFPAALSAFYPYPAIVHVLVPEFAFSLLALGIAAILILMARRRGEALFGPLFYLVAIFPVLQLVPVGSAIAADRYAYLPSIGMFMLAGLFFDRLCSAVCSGDDSNGGKAGKRAVYAAICTIIICLSLLTMRRCLVWRDSRTLWADAIDKHPASATAYLNMGEALLSEERLDEAIRMLKRSAELDPNGAKVYTNLGDAYRKKGRLKEAEEALSRAVRLEENSPIARNNLGLVYAEQKLYTKARPEFEKAISLKADYAEPHNNLGIIYKMNGDAAQAIREFQKAIAINSLYRDAYHNMAATMERDGNVGGAIENFKRAIELKPGFAPAHNDLGLIYARTGMIPNAIEEFEKTIQLEPGFSQAYYNLALCWHLKGDGARAAENLRIAVSRGYSEVSPEMRGYLEAGRGK